MKKLSPLRIAAPLTLLALVSACNMEPETIDGNPKEETPAAANGAAPVELPPMVVAKHTYRCKDNSLAQVEFYSDKSARVTIGDAPAVTLTQSEEGGPFTAEGYSVTGPGTEVTLTLPGKSAQSCKA